MLLKYRGCNPHRINQRQPGVNDVHDFRAFHDVHGSRDVHGCHDVRDSHDVHVLPFHPCLFDQLASPGLSCPSAKQ
jgi:hypothetical protein